MNACSLRGEPLHAGLVPQDAASGDGAGRIDGEDGDAFVPLFDDVHADGVEEGAFACSRRAGDSDAARTAGVRQAGFQHLRREILIGFELTFDQCDGAGEDDAIGGENAVDVLGGGEPAMVRSRHGFTGIPRENAAP